MNAFEQEFAERSSWYTERGMTPLINAKGTYTTLGGTLPPSSVTDAMTAASQAFVPLEELNDWAGEIVAEHTGAEAGYVTAGAAAAMTLQAAACIAGDDPDGLPANGGNEGAQEILLRRAHDSEFVKLYEVGGATIRWIDDGDGFEVGRFADAIDDRTAAIGYVASKWLPGSVDEVAELVAIGNRYDIPVVVDAAAMLPPAKHLRDFTAAGADLVGFSGGKAIRGPQSTGLLAGRSDLIEAARVHNSPNIGVNRGAKVCKEEIAGLVAALERFVELDHDARQARWQTAAETVVTALRPLEHVRAAVEYNPWRRPVPQASVAFTDEWSGPPAQAVHDRLLAGNPAIGIGVNQRPDEDLCVNPHCLEAGEIELVKDRLLAVLDGSA